jgi:hypothetical protein
MIIPESYSGAPTRLDAWCHGRGETLSELAFLDQRRKQVGQIAPKGALVLHPYGRYCCANKFAGEIDLIEAIDHASKFYAIDEEENEGPAMKKTKKEEESHKKTQKEEGSKEEKTRKEEASNEEGMEEEEESKDEGDEDEKKEDKMKEEGSKEEKESKSEGNAKILSSADASVLALAGVDYFISKHEKGELACIKIGATNFGRMVYTKSVELKAKHGELFVCKDVAALFLASR